MPVERITLFCFGASYAVALVLELIQLKWPRGVQRLAANLFAAAGLLAHTLFLAVQRPPLATQFGSLLFLAWILAVFCLYGSIHHSRLAWGVFVWPVVLGLTILAGTFDLPWFKADTAWGLIHGGLLLLAAVGVCVGFVASIMYLVQAHRLKAKVPPGEGVRLLSLERLEDMNRRAITWAFPLLSAGVIVGLVMMTQGGARGWVDPKILSAVLLWIVFALVLYLRYGIHLQGRRLAFLTIVTFVLLVFTLVFPHTVVQGGGP